MILMTPHCRKGPASLAAFLLALLLLAGCAATSPNTPPVSKPQTEPWMTEDTIGGIHSEPLPGQDTLGVRDSSLRDFLWSYRLLRATALPLDSLSRARIARGDSLYDSLVQLRILGDSSGTSALEGSRWALPARSPLYRVPCGDSGWQWLEGFGGRMDACLDSAAQAGRSDDVGTWLQTALTTLPEAEALLQALRRLGELAYNDGRMEEAAQHWRMLTAKARDIQTIAFEARRSFGLLSYLDSIEQPALREEIRGLLSLLQQNPGFEAINNRVLALMQRVKNPGLRAELKRLNQAAWEKEGALLRSRLTEIERQVLESGDTAAALAELARAARRFERQDQAGIQSLRQRLEGDKGGVAPSNLSIAALRDALDSLYARGQYLEGYRLLQSAGARFPNLEKDWALKLGERYCEEKRSGAADLYRRYRQGKGDKGNTALLREAENLLDQCIHNFPFTESARKAERNQASLKRELAASSPGMLPEGP